MGCSRDDAKELFNRILFDGSVSVWKRGSEIIVNAQTSTMPTVVAARIEAGAKARGMVLDSHPGVSSSVAGVIGNVAPARTLLVNLKIVL